MALTTLLNHPGVRLDSGRHGKRFQLALYYALASGNQPDLNAAFATAMTLASPNGVANVAQPRVAALMSEWSDGEALGIVGLSLEAMHPDARVLTGKRGGPVRLAKEDRLALVQSKPNSLSVPGLPRAINQLHKADLVIGDDGGYWWTGVSVKSTDSLPTPLNGVTVGAWEDRRSTGLDVIDAGRVVNGSPTSMPTVRIGSVGGPLRVVEEAELVLEVLRDSTADGRPPRKGSPEAGDLIRVLHTHLNEDVLSALDALDSIRGDSHASVQFVDVSASAQATEDPVGLVADLATQRVSDILS